MLLPEEVYRWLITIAIMPNQGEINEKGFVSLPLNLNVPFQNGFNIGEIIKKMIVESGEKIPNCLLTVKNQGGKNTKLTNWNFIWLAFDNIDLKVDTRIKDLILQGQNTLIVEILKQLYDRYARKDKNEMEKVKIKEKAVYRSQKASQRKTQPIDLKKINLQKNPEESESSLEFLILLLTSSLSMPIEQILGLFTNQNKFLAHIIVKGVNDNYDGIILFYSLLNKYSSKLKDFYQTDKNDAESCLYALKPGFISKNERVAELTIELFGKLGNIYQWFVSDDSKCVTTLMLGIKRHSNIREAFWELLLEIIAGEQIQFFSKYYITSFQQKEEMVEISQYLIKPISECFLGEKLGDIGIIANWIEFAVTIFSGKLDSQVLCYKLLGEVMLFLPELIQQNEECLQVFTKDWKSKTLTDFVCLFNEIMIILQKLGECKSIIAGRMYLIVVEMLAQVINQVDKKEYLVQNFVPMIGKFPTIPSEYFIQHYKEKYLSSSDFLLICEAIEINEDISTLTSVGYVLKDIMLKDIVVNFYLATLICEIAKKSIINEVGIDFINKIVEEVLSCYGQFEIKKKPALKAKPQPMYFNQKGNSDKLSKEETEEYVIREKEMQILLQLTSKLVDISFTYQQSDLQEMLKDKILKANSFIRVNNHKIGSKALEALLVKRFGVLKEQQAQHSDEFQKKFSANLQQSMVKRSKMASSQITIVTNKLKGPQGLKKEFEMIIQKRKKEEEDRRAEDERKQKEQQRKRLFVKKELQLTNLLRGTLGQAQIREEGYWQKLIKQSKQLQVITPDLVQNRDLQAIQSLLKRYHKVLRHLFTLYTGTMYSIKGKNSQKFEDNQQRKQIITVVQISKMLKDYKLHWFSNGNELQNLVKDINIKIFNKREVIELDYAGFQQFIIQFCYLIFPRRSSKQQQTNKTPLIVSISESIKDFFIYLKDSFVQKGEKLGIFEDISDLPLTAEQKYEIQIYNKKLEISPNYILPQGYKKIAEKTVQFSYQLTRGNAIINLGESFAVAIEIIEMICSKQPLGIHLIESISKKTTVYHVKPSTMTKQQLQFPKYRAMSTLIQRKSPLQAVEFAAKKRSFSKGLIQALNHIPPSKKAIAEEAAQSLDKITKQVERRRESQNEKTKKAISNTKIAEIQKVKKQFLQKREKQRREAEDIKKRKEREEERRRREQTQKFLEEQRVKLNEKKKKQEEQKAKKMLQEEAKLNQKLELKQKFKQFHQNQLGKIKKIYEVASQKIKKSKQDEQQQKQKNEQMYKRLRQKIQSQDKRKIQQRKQTENKINALYESEAVKRVFKTYEGNLKAIFQFLIRNTFLSLTQRKHNNEVIYDTWRYFNSVFEFTPLIMNAKDVVQVFKVITRDKPVSKQYHIGLNFSEFQQALFRIAIKHKTIFNIIADKIKDKEVVPPPPPRKVEEKEITKIQKSKKGAKQSKEIKSKDIPKVIEKQENQFDTMAEIDVKQLLREKGKDSDDNPNIQKVNEKTIRGLIYFLKVPGSKVGQQRRFRQLIQEKPNMNNAVDRLKERLSEEYTFQESPARRKSVKLGGQSQASLNPISQK